MEERPSISWPESFAGEAGSGSLFNWMMRSNSAQAALIGAGLAAARTRRVKPMARTTKKRFPRPGFVGRISSGEIG